VVSERTVARYLQRVQRRGDPGKSWLTFLTHQEVIAAFDLFTVPTLSFQAWASEDSALQRDPTPPAEWPTATMAEPMRTTRSVLPEAYYQKRTTRSVLPEAYYQKRTTRSVLPEAYYQKNYPRPTPIALRNRSLA
jgi:hypothetical protein